MERKRGTSKNEGPNLEEVLNRLGYLIGRSGRIDPKTRKLLDETLTEEQKIAFIAGAEAGQREKMDLDDII